MASTGPLLSRRLNHRCSNFWKSLTFPSVSHNSATSLNLQPHFMLADPNQVRNQSLGSIHLSEERSANTTTSIVLYIKTGRNVLMHVEKQMLLSTKPRPIAGWISCTVLCQKLASQMYGESFEASTVHQIPTRPMKPCLITVEQSPTPSPRLSSSLIIMPGSARSTWPKRTIVSTDFWKNVPMLDQLTTTTAPPSTCWNSYQQFRRWNAKELLAQTVFHQHSSDHLVF